MAYRSFQHNDPTRKTQYSEEPSYTIKEESLKQDFRDLRKEIDAIRRRSDFNITKALEERRNWEHEAIVQDKHASRFESSFERGKVSRASSIVQPDSQNQTHPLEKELIRKAFEEETNLQLAHERLQRSIERNRSQSKEFNEGDLQPKSPVRVGEFDVRSYYSKTSGAEKEHEGDRQRETRDISQANPNKFEGISLEREQRGQTAFSSPNTRGAFDQELDEIRRRQKSRAIYYNETAGNSYDDLSNLKGYV